MSGYDNNRFLRNSSYHLMNGRLGYTDRQDPLSEPLFLREKIDENDNNTDKLDTQISGVHNQRFRLMQHGGVAQQERMIYDKRRSLDSALLYSYQGANVSKVGEEEKIMRALINPNKLKMDYDDKIISIGYESGFQPGDVFKWHGTNTYWLIYLQDTTELAYFRGDVRKCSYQVNWEDEDGLHSSWLAVRGPVETKINYIQKHQISIDNPNYTLNVLMPKTDAALKYFKRYAKFYLQDDKTICWRVNAIDTISTPGIIELTAQEYYINEIEDDVDNGLVGILKPTIQDPNAPEIANEIIGDTFIKPYLQYLYTYIGEEDENAHWIIQNQSFPIQYAENPENSKQLKLMWNASYSGQFDITYNGITKTIVVESLM